MGRWLLRRLAQTVVGVWLLASLVFLLSHQGPGTEQLVLTDATDLSAGGSATTASDRERARQTLRARLQLNQPLFYASRVAAQPGTPAHWQWHGPHNQYHRWAQQMRQGNFGVSLRTGQPVLPALVRALSYTLPLTGTAALLTVAGALLLAPGLAARASWPSRGLRLALATLQALPLFVLALALLLLLANPAVLNWFPAYGAGRLSEASLGWWAGLNSRLAYAVLPVASLTLAALPALTLQLEAGLAQELRAPYATTARAKGLAEPRVARHHALRNALLPLLTQFTDLLPALVAGAVVVEVVFAVPGMGRLLAGAAAGRDYPLLVGGIVLTGAARLLALTLADALYFWADPRIRWQR